MKKKFNWKLLLSSLLIVYATAIIGSLFTSGNTNSAWYESIKPSITPPNWVFPIVWNILFLLIGLSLYLSWNNSNKKDKNAIASIFAANLGLNILWSLLYFELRMPAFAFFELIILWISILVMIFTVAESSKKAGWLLVPYFIWVTFAGILNYLSAF